MAEVITLETRAARCRECRHGVDCPMLDESGMAADTVMQTRVRVLHRGDRLFREGDAVEALFRIRSGVVKTSLTDTDGSEQVTGFYGPGEWIGLDALESARHGCEATALDTTSVCVFARSALSERIAHSGRAAHLLIGALGERVHAQSAMHMCLARDNAAQRLAAFLLDLSQRRCEASLDGEDIALPMSRAEIASYLALAVETVSRLLTRMDKAGTLKVHRSRVEILDPQALRRLAARAPRLEEAVSGSA